MRAGYCLGCKRSALLEDDLCYSCNLNDVKFTKEMWEWEAGDEDVSNGQTD